MFNDLIATDKLQGKKVVDAKKVNSKNSQDDRVRILIRGILVSCNLCSWY